MIIPGYQQGIERKWNEITDSRKKLSYLLKEKTIYESMSDCSDTDRIIKWFNSMIERTKIDFPIQTNTEQASNQSTRKSIRINENFDEYVDRALWNERGIAEIRRAYKEKNDNPTEITYYTKYDKENRNSLDIAAKGITAYYSFRTTTSVSGIVTEVGSFKGYKIYYDHCMAILRRKEENKPLYEGEKRSEIDLIYSHLIDEEENFKQYQLFYEELKYESDMEIVEKIKKAVLYYPKWVNETYLTEDSQYFTNGSSNQNKQISQVKGYSDLFEALSKYITGISDREFTNIISDSRLDTGTQKAKWIGEKVDACYFADYLKMAYRDWNKCFLFNDSKPLHKKYQDKLEKGSPVLDILKQYLPK